MSDANLSIADELEAAIAAGTAGKCAETAERVTALFLASAGSYSHERIGALAFRISGHDLLLRMPWQEQEIPGLALDNTHIAYEDFGLITFHTTLDGAVSSLEWWTNLFTPIA